MERVAEESLSTDFKLNLHSECSKTFEFDNLKGEINEEVKNGEEVVVNIWEVSASLVEVEIQNENHFAALDDEPIYDNEGLKDSVTVQACQDLDLGLAELFEVKESTEATEISGSILAHEVKSLYRRYASISWFLFHLRSFLSFSLYIYKYVCVLCLFCK